MLQGNGPANLPVHPRSALTGSAVNPSVNQAVGWSVAAAPDMVPYKHPVPPAAPTNTHPALPPAPRSWTPSSKPACEQTRQAAYTGCTHSANGGQQMKTQAAICLLQFHTVLVLPCMTNSSSPCHTGWSFCVCSHSTIKGSTLDS